MSNNKIYRGEGIIYDDAAISTKELVESSVMLGQISLYLKTYRSKNNLTQAELANLLGVNQVMVCKLERGNYNPTLKQLLKMSYKLTRSNKMFFELLKNISKSVKEDYTYNVDDLVARKQIKIKKNTTAKKDDKKKSIKNAVNKNKRKKVCA